MILSLHIPKTAGVTIRNVLKRHFGPGFVLWYWQITDAWGRVHPDVPAGADCVHGHVAADQLAAKFPFGRLITWVRDPVQRVVSSYYHRLRDPDWQHPVCLELHRKKLSLADYAALPLVRNEMSRFFGRTRPDDYLFIGVVEEFDASFRRMRQLLGISDATAGCDNRNPAKVGERYELDPGLHQEILQLNAADALLYASCLARTDTASGAVGRRLSWTFQTVR